MRERKRPDYAGEIAKTTKKTTSCSSSTSNNNIIISCSKSSINMRESHGTLVITGL